MVATNRDLRQALSNNLCDHPPFFFYGMICIRTLLMCLDNETRYVDVPGNRKRP